MFEPSLVCTARLFQNQRKTEEEKVGGQIGTRTGLGAALAGKAGGSWPWWGLSCRLSLLSPSLDHLDPDTLQAAPGDFVLLLQWC